jgi:hypothetical protein
LIVAEVADSESYDLRVACPNCGRAGTATVNHTGAIVNSYIWAVGCRVCGKPFSVTIVIKALP